MNQTLKLSIPSLRSEFVYQGDFSQMSYDSLLAFACGQLQIPLCPLQFVYCFHDQVIQFWEPNNFNLIKDIVAQNQVQEINFTLVEQMTAPVHQVTCSTCRAFPIHGTCYKCYECKNTFFCGNCFSRHSHALIMFNDPEALKTSQDRVKEAAKQTVKFIGALFSAACTSMTAFAKEKKRQYDLEKEQKRLAAEVKITEKLLKLPQLYEQNPQKYAEIVKKGQKMNLKELADYID